LISNTQTDSLRAIQVAHTAMYLSQHA